MRARFATTAFILLAATDVAAGFASTPRTTWSRMVSPPRKRDHAAAPHPFHSRPASTTTTALPASRHLLPVLSYAGLASVTAGALHLVQPFLAGQGVALVGGCVAVPAGFVLLQLLLMGGSGVAKHMGGVPADASLTALAHDAAAAVGVPPPRHVFEIARQEPNAFAASGLFGSSQTTVAVTSGLRGALTTRELQAVLAHEMGHLRHDDVARNMHVAVAAAGLGGIYKAGRILLDASFSDKKESKSEKDKNEGGGAALGLALMAGGLGAQALAHLAQLAASRGSELQADRAAAEAYGADALISALRKIDAAAARAPADLRASGAAAGLMAHAMISGGPSDSSSASAAAATSGADGGVGFFGRLGRMLSTHPPTSARVQALENAAAAGLVPASHSD